MYIRIPEYISDLGAFFESPDDLTHEDYYNVLDYQIGI